MDVEFKMDFGNGFVTIEPPINKDAIALDVIFVKDKARAQLQSINFEWVSDTAKKIIAYKDAGLAGGKGIAYGLPLKLKLCSTPIAGAPINVDVNFDLMLNLGHSAARFECDRVLAPIREEGGNDWFEKETQAFSFWFLATGILDPANGYKGPGKIIFSDYKKTPYAITTIPDGTQIVTLSITAFLVALQIIQAVQLFIDYIALGAAALVAVPPHVGLSVLYFVLAAAQVVFIIILINLFIKLLKEILDNIIQLKKYKLCMREADHFLKLCEYIGVKFTSSIYGYTQSFVTSDGYGGRYVNATWMPQKVVMPTLGSPLNFNFIFDRPGDEQGNLKSFGHFEGTADEFIKVMEGKYNAEAKVINGVLFFEEKHFHLNTNPYIIPNTAEPGYTFNLPDPHGTNLSELAPYTRLAFQIDESELNTLHRYRGTSVAVTITNPQFPVNKFSGWGEGRNINLGSALAKRKEFLNRVEQKIFDLLGNMIIFIKIAANLPGSQPSNLLQTLNVAARIGWMELSNDSFSVPKTFIGVDRGGDWEIHPNSEATMAAKSLLDDFHGFDLATRGNQWLTFFNKKSAFCCEDFVQIRNSNILQTPDTPPKSGKFTAMLWTLADEIAENTDYRINEDYLKGLVETIKIDGTTKP